MDILPIAELRPELPKLDLKHIKAVVSLVWPYSSAQREFALLLAEPDFRLRHKKGQTRVRFTRSCAKAIAATSIGIGDTVILGLQGVQFVEKDDGIRTPGRSIDWELAFSQTLVVQIFRDENEIASLNIVDAAPTPAQSPGRRKPHATPTQTPLKNPGLYLGDGPQWSSPAFLKRSRLSDGPFFEAGRDPLAKEVSDTHDKKRRRKSYKDWNVWTYSKRTPSPEKDDPAQEDLANSPTQSPIHRASLPATPVSPAKSQLCPIADGSIEYSKETVPHDGHEEDDDSPIFEDDADGFSIREVVEKKTTTKDFERDADYYDLYAGPDELPPEDTQYTFGGDTEENTEVEEDAVENAAERQDIIKPSSPTEADSDESDEEQDLPGKTQTLSDLSSSEAAFEHGTAVSSTEEDSINEVDDEIEEHEIAMKSTYDRRVRERSGNREDPIGLDVDDDVPAVMPPPPKLSFLQTNFLSQTPGTLTPIGKEPRSPTLKPLDSSTLPMPSPFPGDLDGQLTSNLDRLSSSQLVQQEAEELSNEADYIVESSFYSSVSAADARAGLPHHESAFTDVRFTFGMDGSTFTRPKSLLESPPPGVMRLEDDEEDVQEHIEAHVATENGGGAQGDQEEPIIIHQDTLEETEHILASDQENKENIFQGESEGNLDEENIENSNVAHQIADEVEGKAAVEQEFALQNELEQQLPSDMFNEFTNQDPSSADQDMAASLLSLSQPQAPPRLPTPSQPIQSEIIVLSSDSESKLDEDSNESESEIEEGILSDADVSKEAEHDTDPNEDTDNDRQELDDEEPLTDYQDSIATNNPEISMDVIDLGSGSGADSDDELHAHRESVVVLNDVLIDEVVGDQNTVSHISQAAAETEIQDVSPIRSEMRREAKPPAVDGGGSELISVETAPSGFTAVNVANKERTIHTELLTEQITESYEDDYFTAIDNVDQPPSSDVEDDFMPDAGSTQATNREPEREIPETLDLHPDIKMETIEDRNPFQWDPATSSQPQDDDQDSVMGAPAEILIEVPMEGDKMGASTKKTVPATAPARNTRSKTKMSISPTKDETAAPQSSIRSRRSKASLTPGSRMTLPLADGRSPRSTMSPVKDTMSASPYSLRSQSKFVSPTKSILSPNITVERGSIHRKRRGRQHSDPPSSPLADSFGEPEQGHFQMNLSGTFDYQPSQELGTQTHIQESSKYSNVVYVRDSEEGSMRSEHSITTASDPWSEDLEGPPRMFDYSDQVEPVAQIGDRSVTQIRDRGSKPPEPSPSIHGQLSVINDSSPRRPRKESYDRSSDSVVEGSATPKALSIAEQVAYPNLPLQGDSKRDQVSTPSTPLAELDLSWTKVAHSEAEGEEHIPSSPPTQSRFASIRRQSLMTSNMPLTPNATQSFAQSQPSFSAATSEVAHSMPRTPQLTQRTLTGSRSLKTMHETDVGLSLGDGEVFTGLHGQPTTIFKTTPRRNVIGADVASPERSPSVHSEDLSGSDSETQTLVNADLGPPFIGLSTPISYYTPLKDLRYFLNRSSQFVENPDVLALVVSASTVPKKADKGPKHWSTTLSITDISSYPLTTTVQVFRPFAKALPVAEEGDVVLLRNFVVKSLNRKVMLRSGEESAWCVWRYGKPVWGTKRERYGEVKSREDVRGPEVERGNDERGEVERVRGWWVTTVRPDLKQSEYNPEGKENGNEDKGKEKATVNSTDEPIVLKSPTTT
jgi:hypothetical protein